jgi:DNA gyrase subunit A
METADTGKKVLEIDIEREMRHSYIDYSMSVIVSRALPDIRDGLKPVQRRILVAMKDLNLTHDKPFRKSAKITGDTNGNYHPHGTPAIYEAMVRMGQEFSLRYPIINGQGNFGSVDGDAPAAERYTEARLMELAEEVLADLDKDTVDFVANYDETREEPTVLPSKVPNLLINGATGIAVGMATNIPPHNLGEIAEALTGLIEEPDMPDEGLLRIVRGPDFPTGGVIYGKDGIRSCYLRGRGHMTLRARATIETDVKTDRECIVITEIPFQVNKAAMLERMASLVRDGKIQGIYDIRDESDREGLRVVVELKKDAQTRVVLNQLYKHTQMQTTFGANMLALVDNQPRTLSLRSMLLLFLDHRREVITRRTKFELAEAEKRAHIVEGLRIALGHIDEVIALIKKSADREAAREGLMARFSLSEIQANAILEMRLQRLTGLERDKLEQEYLELIKLIARLKEILENPRLVDNLIKEELADLKERFGDERRTEIAAGETQQFEVEDLIAEEDMVVTISHAGYVKRLPVATYRSQRRGGRGVAGTARRDEDFIEHLFVASTHNYLLVLTNLGRCHWLKVHEIPLAGRTAKGKAIVNLINKRREERVTAVVPVRSFDERHFLVMATRNGTIKKTSLSAYSNPRRGGIAAITLGEGDELIGAVVTDGTAEMVLAKRQGKAIRFNERVVRPMGRTAHGVIGVTLEEDDSVVEMVALKEARAILVVTENGYGKRSRLEDYRVTGRGGKGVITVRNTKRNGPTVSVKGVREDDEVMIITKNGLVIRTQVKGISMMGRDTQGVKLINLAPGDKVVSVGRVITSAGEKEEVGEQVVGEKLEADEGREGLGAGDAGLGVGEGADAEGPEVESGRGREVPPGEEEADEAEPGEETSGEHKADDEEEKLH